MKVLVVGGGGREHALAWKIAQSHQVTKLYCAPGNPGIAGVAECLPIDPDNIAALRDAVKAYLQSNPKLVQEIDTQVRKKLGLISDETSPAPQKAEQSAPQAARRTTKV